MIPKESKENLALEAHSSSTYESDNSSTVKIQKSLCNNGYFRYPDEPDQFQDPHANQFFEQEKQLVAKRPAKQYLSRMDFIENVIVKLNSGQSKITYVLNKNDFGFWTVNCKDCGQFNSLFECKYSVVINTQFERGKEVKTYKIKFDR